MTDGRAFAGEERAVARPDAGGHAGDDRCPVVECAHVGGRIHDCISARGFMGRNSRPGLVLPLAGPIEVPLRLVRFRLSASSLRMTRVLDRRGHFLAIGSPTLLLFLHHRMV